MAIKVLANTIATATANNVYNATAVLLTNDSTARTVTIANTVSIENGGGIAGSIRLPVDGAVVIRKRPSDTVLGAATCYATKVDDGSSY